MHILRLPNDFVTIFTRVKIREQQRLIQIVSSRCDINPDIVLDGVYNASHSLKGAWAVPAAVSLPLRET
jgi:hypothetical protein